MKRLWRYLRRLWRGVPEHVTKYDPNMPWSNPDHDVMADVRAYLDYDAKKNGGVLQSQVDFWDKIKRDPSPGVYNPDGITARDLMDANEKALWEDIEGGPPKHPPIEYPAKAEQSTQDWVTERLEELTGGLTRHPMDMTNYPTPPNEKDIAAREMFNGPTSMPVPRAMFSHGYSMRYLGELKRRADAKDRTLTAEELMGLRARGLA